MPYPEIRPRRLRRNAGSLVVLSGAAVKPTATREGTPT